MPTDSTRTPPRALGSFIPSGQNGIPLVRTVNDEPIGGYAVFFHAQRRMVEDMDVFLESSPKDALAVYKALAEFGAPLAQFRVEDFADGKTIPALVFLRSVLRSSSESTESTLRVSTQMAYRLRSRAKSRLLISPQKISSPTSSPLVDHRI